MKTHFQRIASLFLAVALSVTMITFAAPSASAVVITDVYDTASVLSWNSYVSSVGDDTTVFWSMMNSACADVRVGEFESMEKLQNAAHIWRTRATTLRNQLALKTDVPYPVIVYDASYGVYRIQDRLSGNYIVNASGRFAYYCDSAASVPDDYKDTITESTRKDTWLPIVTAASSKKVAVLSKDSLSDLAVTVNQTDRTCSMRDTYINDQRFYVIIDSSNNIYANADKVPYVAHYDATATDVKYDYIVNEGDTVDNSTTIDNSQVIDQSNGVFNYIDTQNNTTEEFYIDELIYDFSSQSYSADTYNVTYDNDTYNTYNYTWNITYNITNTYVTNIGQTELYQPLELYYQLPDGRSSADLTAEEVASMSFEFADCVNYAKSATDTYLRALYHFDGNTDDSSYFSTQGKFEWVKGASISYLDVGTFDGALYLGPEAHEFKITLPSNIGSGDFTLQFRYYQEGAADTQDNIENSLSIGGNTVLRWDEGYLYPQTSTTSCSALSVGTWAELAVIRHSGTTYLYHNGLCIASFADTAAYSGNIVLILGDTTRASSMIDELRVVNFAVAESSASYTCTSVPYDTNAVLVLPDSEFPIADEYWDVTSSGENLLSYTLDDFIGGIPSSLSKYSSVSTFPEFSAWSTQYMTFFQDLGYYRFTSLMPDTTTNQLMDGNFNLWAHGYRTQISTCNSYEYNDGTTSSSSREYLPVGDYVFSVVLSDGTVCSLPFSNTLKSGTYSVNRGNLDGFSYKYNFSSVASFEWGFLRHVQVCQWYSGNYITRNYYNYLEFCPYDSVDIMYMELVEGDTTDLTAEWVTCMYSSEEVKPNTAAIQTDIPINGYTVGGVRPTFPVRGDVWMPVSNNRISGCYIYNGTAWESVNARWYTGTRWIPIYAFDLTTLQDCWDIADIDSVVSTIATESEFWNWWKSAWTDFRSWLSGNIGGASGSNAVGSDKLPDEDSVEDNPDTEEDESKVGYSIFDLAKALVDGTWKFVKGIVRTATGGITGIFTAVVNVDGFFDAYDDGSEIFGIVSYGGDDIWD